MYFAIALPIITFKHVGFGFFCKLCEETTYTFSVLEIIQIQTEFIKMQKKNWKLKLGIGLIILSIPIFLSLPLIPFLNLESQEKITLTTILFISAEILFWSGGLLLGKELFSKYKGYLNPTNWGKKK